MIDKSTSTILEVHQAKPGMDLMAQIRSNRTGFPQNPPVKEVWLTKNNLKTGVSFVVFCFQTCFIALHVWHSSMITGCINLPKPLILLMEEIRRTSWGWWCIPLFSGFYISRWWRISEPSTVCHWFSAWIFFLHVFLMSKKKCWGRITRPYAIATHQRVLVLSLGFTRVLQVGVSVYPSRSPHVSGEFS